VETGLALLAASSIPQRHWDEAFITASFLINQLPTLVLNHISLVEKLFIAHQITSFYMSSAVLAGPTFTPTTDTKWISSPRCVFFLDTVLSIRGTNASMYLPGVYMLQGT
jgi:hypothetical protein